MYFTNHVFPHQLEHGLDLKSINPIEIFIPVLPLFEVDSSLSSSPSSSNSISILSSPTSKIPPVFMHSFQAEQARSLDEKHNEMAKIFPINGKLITVKEAQLLVSLLHINQICGAYFQGVNYIENMLLKQLTSAIGKVITSQDFSNYLTFHNRKLFKSNYLPKPFCYSIRRAGHDPEVCYTTSSIII